MLDLAAAVKRHEQAKKKLEAAERRIDPSKGPCNILLVDLITGQGDANRKRLAATWKPEHQCTPDCVIVDMRIDISAPLPAGAEDALHITFKDLPEDEPKPELPPAPEARRRPVERVPEQHVDAPSLPAARRTIEVRPGETVCVCSHLLRSHEDGEGSCAEFEGTGRFHQRCSCRAYQDAALEAAETKAQKSAELAQLAARVSSASAEAAALQRQVVNARQALLSPATYCPRCGHPLQEHDAQEAPGSLDWWLLCKHGCVCGASNRLGGNQ